MMSTEPDSNPSNEPASLIPPESTLPGNDSTPPEDKTTQPEPAPAPEPLTWDAIKLPEGITVDDASRDSFLEIMNNSELSASERAQKLVDLQTNLMQRGYEESLKQWGETRQSWQDEVRADPEIGGEKLAPALGEIAKLINKYGSPELRDVLTSTGAGDNIHVIKLLHNIAKDLSEGGPVLGAPSQQSQSLAQQLYPSMKPKQGA